MILGVPVFKQIRVVYHFCHIYYSYYYILFCSPMLRLAMDCPVLEDTLMRVLVIGLSRDLPLSPADALDFADILIRRAANQQAEGKYSFKYMSCNTTKPTKWHGHQAKMQGSLGICPI